MIIVLIVFLAVAFGVARWYHKNSGKPGFDDWDKGDWQMHD